MPFFFMNIAGFRNSETISHFTCFMTRCFRQLTTNLQAIIRHDQQEELMISKNRNHLQVKSRIVGCAFLFFSVTILSAVLLSSCSYQATRIPASETSSVPLPVDAISGESKSSAAPVNSSSAEVMKEASTSVINTPEADTGADATPAATASAGAMPEASAGADAAPVETASADARPDAGAGVDATPAATAGADATPEASAAVDATPSTSPAATAKATASASPLSSPAGPSAFQLQPPTKGDTTAIMKTTLGDLSIRLLPSEAPKAVENFITHAKAGYYDGLIFHRVIRNFMIQGGDPTGTGRGGESIWGAPFEDEFTANAFNFRGALSMANSGADTNGSQFFIVQADEATVSDKIVEQLRKGGWPEAAVEGYDSVGGTYHLDGKHTVFGQVYKGFDVLDQIAGVKTDGNDRPVEDVKILAISITTY